MKSDIEIIYVNIIQIGRQDPLLAEYHWPS